MARFVEKVDQALESANKLLGEQNRAVFAESLGNPSLVVLDIAGAPLTAAAGRGVQCRLMADAVGSRTGLERLTPQLRSAGVEVVPMLPVGFWRHNAARFDLRRAGGQLSVGEPGRCRTQAGGVQDDGFAAPCR